MSKSLLRIGSLLCIVVAVGAVVWVIQHEQKSDIPIPFLQEGSVDLRGRVTPIGRKKSIVVERVEFPQGTTMETLVNSKIYLVSVPDEPTTPSVTLDQAVRAMGSGSRIVNYYGYKYTSANAAVEKEHRDDAEFLSRFPGQFFVSASALREDASHGGTIAAFMSRNNVSMLSTDGNGAIGLERNSLYVLIENETRWPAMFTIAQLPPCGDGHRTPLLELCDDGNTRDGDGCDHYCQMERGWDCTGQPSTCTRYPSCGNGEYNPEIGEECDDGNVTNGDGCDGNCKVESGWTCENYWPSVCTQLPVCGDGAIEGSELCDDSNTAPGDGCDGSCQVESGWTCTRADPSVCTMLNTCGNQSIESGEECDDWNRTSGDGCSDTCHIEEGWTCVGMQRSICALLPVCGNSQVENGESCDDGNRAINDGCSENCLVEWGWDCNGASPTVCTPQNVVCGNGVIQGGEGCDDRNRNDGDGCSSTCTMEYRWNCSGQPSVCVRSICANGAIETGETCDDGNAQNNDGCSSNCDLEFGWICTGQPSVCARSLCGNGLVEPLETCDDHNSNPGDGCSNTCQTENGWNCTGEPSVCANTCGNGAVDASETCDDTNRDGNDGCDGSCQIETGWTCTGEPSVCTPANPACGDGFVNGNDACDDGNSRNRDGCSSSCQVESGWTCSGTHPSSCTRIPACGNSLREGTEACDDGNTAGGDGCSSSCQAEDGWSCGYTYPSVCTQIPRCGDGLVDHFNNEQCDDGNTVNGDGCNSQCLPESGWLCTGYPVESCQPVCGDSILEGSEQCESGLAACSGGQVCDSCQCHAPEIPSGIQWDNVPSTTYYSYDESSIATVGKYIYLIGSRKYVWVSGDGATWKYYGDFPVVDRIGAGVATFLGNIMTFGGKPGVPYAPDPYAFSTGYGNLDAWLAESGNLGSTTMQPAPAYQLPMSVERPAMLVYQNDLWLLGGAGLDIQYSQTIYRYTGGAWNEVGMLPVQVGDGGAVVFNGKMWIFGSPVGGGRELFSSTDGVTWQPETIPPVGEGAFSRLLVYRGLLTLVDISAGNALVSADGNAWESVPVSGSFPGLDRIFDAFVSQGKLWFYGYKFGYGQGYTYNQAFLVSPPVVCGDGKRELWEQCDDSNTQDSDGCSSQCRIEPLSACTGDAPSICVHTCGNNHHEEGETCDDGNTQNGDGCSSQCQVEAGWACPIVSPICHWTCGDGSPEASEACDDGNTIGNDGCSAQCQVEAGWVCDFNWPSNCFHTCGNGRIDASSVNEFCDDGNINNDDGCSANCRIESGWTCTTNNPSVCTRE